MTAGVSFLLAFTAGLLSFLSPCFLPLIPVYLAYLSGTSGSKVSLAKTLAFIGGFSLVFIILGASATSLGHFFLQYQAAWRKLSAIVIIIFGLHLLDILPIKLIYREERWFEAVKTKGWMGAFLLGIAFSFGWTPCIGPVLSSILLMASTSQTLSLGILLLVAYSLGLGIPFFLVALFWQYFIGRLSRLNKYLSLLEKVSGVILITMGIMVWNNGFSRLGRLLYFN